MISKRSHGQLQTGQNLPKGWYLYYPSINSQSQATREARISVPFQLAIKLAGAIQIVDVLINVNRTKGKPISPVDVLPFLKGPAPKKQSAERMQEEIKSWLS